jgi:trigger factor
MEVAVETTSGLERRMSVQLPEDDIAGQVAERLRDLTRSASLPGFRPGKVPLKVVVKRFGKQVRQEVVGELLQSSFQDAVTQNELRPAGGPVIDPLNADEGAGLSYTAVFEVYPTLDVSAADGLNIEVPVAEVQESDIDNMLDTLKKQRREWVDVERPAVSEDRATIDFVGTMDGEEFEGGKAESFPLELGQSSLIAGFEDGIVGMSAGEQKVLDLKFPDDYGAEHLAGKEVQFAVTVQSVAEPQLPEMDEEFVKSYGVEAGTVEALREEIGNNMRRELSNGLRSLTKSRVMDQLLEANEIEIPNTLVKDESKSLLESQTEEIRRRGGDPETFGLNAELFETDARRRVALGLLLAELVKTHALTPDAEKVRSVIESMASSYEEPQQVISFYYSDRARLAEVESSVLEDQVVDMLLEKAIVTDDETTFDAVMNPNQGAA